MAQAQAEDFWRAQVSSAGQFGADRGPVAGRLVAVAGGAGRGEEVLSVLCRRRVPGPSGQEAHQAPAHLGLAGQSGGVPAEGVVLGIGNQAGA
ncbi:MAG: hypothetical protein ACK56F_07995, partial [bacterium]